MTTTLTPQIGNQLPPGRQMNDTPAESGSSPRDRELQLLVLEIQASPNRTDRVVRKQIDRLLKEISTGLKLAEVKLIRDWSGIANIESIVAEAVINTLMEALKNIDRYNPEQARFMTWINVILQSRFKDLLRKHRPRHESISIDHPDAMAEAKIAEMSEPESDLSASELSQFIKTDPEGYLAETHIRNHSDATLQRILLLRLDGLKWQEITDRLNIPSHSTVNTFHDRQLHKLNHYFRKYLCE
jgi:RNA polymerase sigma factor (sigma-70 family)